MQGDIEELKDHVELKHLPSFRIGKLQLGFKQLDLLVLDNVIEDFPIRQVGVRLGAVLKELPQCDAQSPADKSNSRCKSQHG